MTNETLAFALNIDETFIANDLLDDMLDYANATDTIPNAIDHFYDDCHAAPDAYLTSSAAFCAANSITDPDDFDFDLYNDCTYLLSYRMILESICAETEFAISSAIDSIRKTAAMIDFDLDFSF